MTFNERALRLQRTAIAAVLGGAAVVFWRGSNDVFNTPKATWIVLGAVATVAIGAVRTSRTRRLVLPWGAPAVSVAAFTVAVIIATLTSETPLRSFVGDPGRHTGGAMYLAYAALAVLSMRSFRTHAPLAVANAMTLASVPVALYALVQANDLGPFDWQAVEGGPQVVSTFGNADFVAAWLGIAIPLAVWTGLRRDLPAWARRTASLVALLAFVASLSTGSLQGAVIAPAGTALVLATWLWTHEDAAVRSRRVPISVGVGALGALVAVIVLAGIGPGGALRDNLDRSLETRTGKWETAIAIVADRPVTGVGMDAYGDYFHTYRSQELAVDSGLRRTVDDPHDVPLAMFVSGGVPLGLAYLAFVVTAGWALLRGLRRQTGEARVLLAGVGGAWVAYQIQSLVSIDVPPIAVTQWVLGGILIARGLHPPVRTFALPGAPPLPKASRKKGKRHRPATPLTPPRPGLLGAIVVTFVAVAAAATWPLRADLRAAVGRDAGARGDISTATRAYTDATAIASWEGAYAGLEAALLATSNEPEDALTAIEIAIEREPRDLAHRINHARLLVGLDRPDAAIAAYDRALELDPTTPEVLFEVGRFHSVHGDASRAVALLERAVELRPDEEEWAALLAATRAQAS